MPAKNHASRGSRQTYTVARKVLSHTLLLTDQPIHTNLSSILAVFLAIRLWWRLFVLLHTYLIIMPLNIYMENINMILSALIWCVMVMTKLMKNSSTIPYFNLNNLSCWSYFQQAQTSIYPENHMPIKPKTKFSKWNQTLFRQNYP